MRPTNVKDCRSGQIKGIVPRLRRRLNGTVPGTLGAHASIVNMDVGAMPEWTGDGPHVFALRVSAFTRCTVPVPTPTACATAEWKSLLYRTG